mmetsp:Transcript_8651/g.26000  ORF Transcript_8651/g.26000 Transcript_8651/m.26000 type:complete len:87 (-) Transcript_8651:168-428(-)
MMCWDQLLSYSLSLIFTFQCSTAEDAQFGMLVFRTDMDYMYSRAVSGVHVCSIWCARLQYLSVAANRRYERQFYSAVQMLLRACVH